jgi:hypothetical protein
MLTITDTQGNVATTPLHLHQLAYLRGKDLSDVMKFGASPGAPAPRAREWA